MNIVVLIFCLIILSGNRFYVLGYFSWKLAMSISGCFSRVEYLEKSKHLQEQLKELRSEIEVLKVDENKSQFDEIHDQNVLHGNGKYTTINRVCDVFCG